MAAEKICAVIVTYNRLSSLRKCVESLHVQTRKPDLIIIVNNGSSDGTKEYLDKIQNNKIHVIHQENSGPGGGFYTGLKFFYELGFDLAWCMDDDCLPEPTALQYLIDTPDFGVCLKNSFAVLPEDKTMHSYYLPPEKRVYLTAEIITGYATLYTGTLFSKEIIKISGYPDPLFFLWGDETEYFFRITVTNNIPAMTFIKSRVVHPEVRPLFFTEWRSTDFFKIYFFLRNVKGFIAKRHSILSKSRILRFLFICREYLLLFKVIMRQKEKRLLKLRILFSAIPAKINGNKISAGLKKYLST